MPLASLHAPFDHHDWIFELKYDGFRALAHIDSGKCRLVSRKGTVYRSFPQLCAAIGAVIPGEAVLDGEIVHLDVEGKPQFYDLMRRRNPQHYYAFDLLCLDGRDLRDICLVERKRLLRRAGPISLRSPALEQSESIRDLSPRSRCVHREETPRNLRRRHRSETVSGTDDRFDVLVCVHPQFLHSPWICISTFRMSVNST
jgi:hypothetical protein